MDEAAILGSEFGKASDLGKASELGKVSDPGKGNDLGKTSGFRKICDLGKVGYYLFLSATVLNTIFSTIHIFWKLPKYFPTLLNTIEKEIRVF